MHWWNECLIIIYELSKDENEFFFIIIIDKFYHKLSEGHWT